MRTLFLAWQDPKSRRWYPVGRLASSNQLYSFQYTKGAEQAAAAGFQPLASFPELRTIYVSEHLFPLFTNRILPHSRPEYGDYLKWLSVPPSERDPVVILSRSGGQRVTDTLEVFPCPEETERPGAPDDEPGLLPPSRYALEGDAGGLEPRRAVQIVVRDRARSKALPAAEGKAAREEGPPKAERER